tara:strand:+ start:1574 stop:2011 length:438 start_codon:yes stop_codon:yes gene_type:complete
MSNIVVNADVYWAFLNNKNMNEKFSVDLCNLSEAAVEKLQSMGLSANSNDKQPEKGQFVTCKSDYPIKAYNSDGDLITEIYDNGLKVANQSKGRAVLSSYDWKNGKGRSPKMLKFFITDLIPYADGNVSEDAGPATAMEIEADAL